MPDSDLAESPTKLNFRPDIQGLRAVAVVLVILAHAGVAGFAGGFVGVDVFFVLSGYLITGLLLEERIATGTIRYGQFLARRLRRLLPAMLVMLRLDRKDFDLSVRAIVPLEQVGEDTEN